VAGIYHGGSALEAGAVICRGSDAKAGSLEGKVTAFMCGCGPAPNGRGTRTLFGEGAAQIETALPGLRAVPAAERASNNQLVLLAHAAAWGTSSIALLIGILASPTPWRCPSRADARDRHFARAGWKRWRVLVLIEMEAAVLGLAGGVLGIVMGWAALRLLAALPQTASIVSASFPLRLLAEALGIAVVPDWRPGSFPPGAGHIFRGGGSAP